MDTVTVNGTPQVFNNMMLFINGKKDIDIQGYIMSINWSTGTQSEHVQTLNQLAEPITVNSINSSPSATITFAPGAYKNFYSFLNDRFTPFTLNFNNYTTGNLNGSTKALVLNNGKLDIQTGSSSAQTPQNTGTFSVKCTSIGWV